MSTPEFPVGTPVEGPYGRADPLTVPDAHPCVCSYIITAPAFHPVWSQYMLSALSLADHADYPPAIVKFEGATHELNLVALNPDGGHVTAEAASAPGFRLRHLTPVNIADQFEATDDEMRLVTWLAARTVVDGGLNPETGDAPTRIREEWLTAVVKTLAHIRGEEHAP